MENLVLGIDIGGSGIKGAPVDVLRGDFVGERHKIATPQPADPDDVVKVVAEVVAEAEAVCDVSHAVGVTFPGVVRGGISDTAANMHPAWIGLNAEELLSECLGGREVHLVNDADAAGIAEMEFGAGRERSGVVVLCTLGTGIGTAVFTEGVLVPNTELGHVPLHGASAERWAAANVRKRENLGWKEWAERLDEYLVLIERLMNPDLFVLGGGVSRRAERFIGYLTRVGAEVVPAELANRAGIVGAALVAAQRASHAHRWQYGPVGERSDA